MDVVELVHRKNLLDIIESKFDVLSELILQVKLFGHYLDLHLEYGLLERFVFDLIYKHVKYRILMRRAWQYLLDCALRIFALNLILLEFGYLLLHQHILFIR